MSGGHSKSVGGIDNGQGKWKYKIDMLEKTLWNKKRQTSVFNTTANTGLDNEESDDSDKVT